MSQEDLSRWYSSSWYSFTYYGNENRDIAPPGSFTAEPSRWTEKGCRRSNSAAAASRRHCRAPPETKPVLYHPPKPTRDKNHSRHRKASYCRKRSSSSEFPEFLKGIDFKSSPFPVITLPPLETSFSPLNGERYRNNDTRITTAIKRENENSYAKSFPGTAEFTATKNGRKRNIFRTTISRIRCPHLRAHHLGRNARDFWNKTRLTFCR